MLLAAEEGEVQPRDGFVFHVIHRVVRHDDRQLVDVGELSEGVHHLLQGPGMLLPPTGRDIVACPGVHHLIPIGIGAFERGHHIPSHPADFDEDMGGQFFPDDGLDILAVMQIAGQFRPSGQDRRHPEGIRVIEQP